MVSCPCSLNHRRVGSLRACALHRLDDAEHAYVSQRKYDADMARKDRVIAELRADVSRFETGGAARRTIISELREKNRYLESVIATSKADIEALSSELQRSRYLSATLRASAVDDDEAAQSAEGVTGIAADGSPWWLQGAEWGASQRLKLAYAVDRTTATWRTAGCALAQLLLHPQLRSSTEAAFSTMAAAYSQSLTAEWSDDASEADGDDGDRHHLHLATSTCDACKGTGVANAVVKNLRADADWMRARLIEVNTAKRAQLTAFVHLVSQTMVEPGGSVVDAVEPSAVETPVDPDTEFNASWRRRSSARAQAALLTQSPQPESAEDESKRHTAAVVVRRAAVLCVCVATSAVAWCCPL